MKRFLCVSIACLVLLCGCTAQPTEQPQGTGETLPPADPVIVPIAERTEDAVKVTVHAGLLGTNSEVLSDEQKADGFTDAVRNEDDSVTYTIAADRYDAFITAYRQSAYDSIVHAATGGSYPSVTGITCSEDLSSIELTAERENYQYSVDAIVVFAVGLISITEQAYDIDAPGTCVITVFDENGEQLSKTVYPDELVL